MKRDKKITRFAKKLVELSRDDQGIVTEGKVGEVLAGLKQVNPRHYLAILKTYLGYVRREIALQTAVVSSPSALSAATLDQLAAAYTRLYARPVSAVAHEDASLIAGVRVRVGDDVYDASVAGRLQRLGESVH